MKVKGQDMKVKVKLEVEGQPMNNDQSHVGSLATHRSHDFHRCCVCYLSPIHAFPNLSIKRSNALLPFLDKYCVPC